MTEAFVQHNHMTRDIKPRGKCPACDVYWEQVKDPKPMENERDDMARIIQLSCATKMKWETAVHYANNLVAQGYGRKPDPPARESGEWAALVEAASNLGTAAALFQNARDAFVAKYPKDKQ